MNKAVLIICMLLMLAPLTISQDSNNPCQGVNPEDLSDNQDCQNHLDNLGPSDTPDPDTKLAKLWAENRNMGDGPQTSQSSSQGGNGDNGRESPNVPDSDVSDDDFSADIQTHTDNNDQIAGYTGTVSQDGNYMDYRVTWDEQGDRVYELQYGDETYTASDCGLVDCDWQNENGEPAQLNEQQQEYLDQAQEKIDDKTDEQYERDTDGEMLPPPAVSRQQTQVARDLAGTARGEILGILNSWTSKWLGDFAMKTFAQVCGDKLYVNDEEDDTEGEGIFGSLRAPESEYESKLENKITGQDDPTVVMTGEKTQVSNNRYRYALNLKIVGKQSDKWVVYFYNSCTKNNSYDDAYDSEGEYGWYEEGAISNLGYKGRHYAGQTGNDMIFECENENCRFDKACFLFKKSSIPGAGGAKKPKNINYTNKPYCVSLEHGGGFFTRGKTGKFEC